MLPKFLTHHASFDPEEMLASMNEARLDLPLFRRTVKVCRGYQRKVYIERGVVSSCPPRVGTLYVKERTPSCSGF